MTKCATWFTVMRIPIASPARPFGDALKTIVIDSGCPHPHATPSRKDTAASGHGAWKSGNRQNATHATNIA